MQRTTSSADAILEQMGDAVIYADVNGIIQRWNRAAESLFGHGAMETIGQSLDLIIPENLRAAHWRGFNAAVKSATTRLNGKPTLTRALHKSGIKLYVEMSFALVVDDTRQVLGAVAVARDVTDKIESKNVAT